ncbi:MAG: SDR family NAD(P)-dependent oxidoreductase [Flavobacteriaceae bacterium]|nr:SDR family NAD(P)-dependent oxidoreductase [Flavobacteriaceae bacterium]MDG2504014.1 SDR family NAD(P)-dependent oxidoreductase [Flavobacteriaceae bacterium]
MEKTFVVTGASRGIGYDLVQHVANQGHTVYALSRSIKTIKKTPKLFPIAIDITDEKVLEEFANQLKDNRVVVDALVNNAGALLNQPFSDTTKEDFEAVYRVNVFGLASLTRLLLPLIDPKGHVVNISSMGGIGGSSKFPGLAAYSSSKGAVNILTELLAEECKESGPSFNALALGAVQTEMLAKAFPGFQAPLSAKEMAQYIFKFAVEGHHFFNGKTLPVSSSTP